MHDSKYIEVARIRNDAARELHIYLEMSGDEVVLSPGHEIDLLARPSPNVQPLTVVYVSDGLQIYASREADPDWHFRFNGRIYAAGSPEATRLAALKTRDTP